jgi:hypothetical protein
VSHQLLGERARKRAQDQVGPRGEPLEQGGERRGVDRDRLGCPVQDRSQGGCFQQQVEVGLGGRLEPARFLDELTVRMPVSDEVKALRLLPGTALATVLRTYFDPSGTPFEIARYTLPGDKITLVYEGRLTKPRRPSR